MLLKELVIKIIHKFPAFFSIFQIFQVSTFLIKIIIISDKTNNYMIRK